MTKRYDELIEVTLDPIEEGAPLRFVWRGRRYDVDQRLSSWRQAGEWWNGARNRIDREFFRVLARPSSAEASGEVDSDGFMIRGAGSAGPQNFWSGAVYDLFVDRVRNEWRIARIWD